MVFSGGKKETTKKTTVLSLRGKKIRDIRSASVWVAVTKNRISEKSSGPPKRKDDRERARDAPVYVARTATARARLRRETLEGARKPVGRVVGWIRGKSRVSGIEREGGRAV